MRKSKQLLEMVCAECGDKPEGKKQGDWLTFKPNCEKCGGKLKAQFIREVSNEKQD